MQYSPVWESPSKTIDIIDSLIKATDLREASLLVFPEMSLTGFTMNSQKFAEEIDGVSFQYFMQLSRKLKKHIFAGIIEKDGSNIYNSLIHFDDKGIIRVIYRKIHPFSFAKEDKHYTAGTKTITTKINGITFGFSICYDLRFPELYRKYGKNKIDVLINIANWPTARINHWNILLQARAIENQCYMIGVNRVGKDSSIEYPGYSSVVNPAGKVLAQSLVEGVTVVEINRNEAIKLREKLPFLDDIKLIY